MSNPVVVEATIDKDQIAGIKGLIESYGDALHLSSKNGKVTCVLLMPIPKDFLNSYGTGDTKLDLKLWQVEFARVVSRACQSPEERKAKRKVNHRKRRRRR